MLMEVGGARKLGVSNRSLMLVIPLCALLLASAIWNIRQYRLVEQKRLQAVAAEREARVKAGRAEAEAERAKLEKKAASAVTDARVSRLYQEINNLTRMSEQVLLRDQSPRGTPVKKNNGQQATSAP
jgi:C4-dicarboxylate-specific signal transduction histidine kinase